MDGQFQDGVLAGIPTWVALMELEDLTLRPERCIDYHASFGTGLFIEGHTEGLLNWLPSWISRAKHGVMQGLDSSFSYHCHYSSWSQHDKERSYRIDPTLDMPAAPLDSIPHMSQAKQLATEWLNNKGNVRPEIRSLRMAMLASLFYAVLIEGPYSDGEQGPYYAKVGLVSRWEDNPAVKAPIIDCLKDFSFFIKDAWFPVETPLEVTVTVSNLEEPMNISLEDQESCMHPISGFPLSLSSLRYLQLPPPAHKSSGSDLTMTGKRRQSSLATHNKRRRTH